MATKRMNICRNCKQAWLVHYDGAVEPEEYRNLGWRVNCECGLAMFGSQWYSTPDEAISEWNVSRFSTPWLQNGNG